MKTAPVSASTVIKRIRRKLAKEGKELVRNRFVDGGWLIIDGKNIVGGASASIGTIAVNLGVLKPWESIQ